MDARVVVVGAPAAEETSAATTTVAAAAAVTRGVATPSPVPSAAPSTVVTATNGGTASASCAPQNPLVVVANPSGNHQQSTAVPRILSRNVNGTLVQTSVPQNEAELQLYRVMQRASLLGYYDTLLEMGGDDVQQLCDAGEEEFLEIMALVGMASKPLHVRRLQKALQEWLTNPSLFQTPVVPTNATAKSPVAVTVGFACASPRSQMQSLPTSFAATSQTSLTSMPYVTTTPQVPLTPLPCRSASPVVPVTSVSVPTSSTTFRQSPSPNTTLPYTTTHSPNVLQVGTCESSCGSGTTPSPSGGGGGGGGGAPASPPQPTPTLLQSQVQRLAEAAERLVATIRPLDPKPHNVKKKLCKNLEMVMTMSDSDPRKMDEIRKYAAIYGRFDCKRKPEKPLTLHEVSVNEAAAQICRFVPALLTRRDELFPLARRVVRDSGYHYSKSQYLSMLKSRENGEEVDGERSKRQKLELEGESEDATQEELDLRCSGTDINNSITRRHRSSSLEEEE
ncbi:NGFI-A-binding protein homolog isoform X2 [Nylanderia fulva]|uniref:NGFI-A-binding protein homolog isoform X2 n=1 Tax=Nylanderia fulva TaxID=613905 RepID=UPI0010FB34E0|nr:NGFI-A-binding protein homolog isoform X2 [Nylanderia fulva]